MINEKILNPFLNILSNEQIGKVLREYLKPSNIILNEIERVLLNALNENKENYKQAALTRWKKLKAEKQNKTQKGDLSKRDFTQRTYSKQFYNNYKRRDEQPIKQDEIKNRMIDPLDDNLI